MCDNLYCVYWNKPNKTDPENGIDCVFSGSSDEHKI